jgi:DNA (cytosine-5)-methyltransferase 1
MEKGNIHRAPIHEDIRIITDTSVFTTVPVLITAGFPCQDISALARNPRGLDGSRSGLIREIWRLIEMLPSVQYVILENSPIIIKYIGGIISNFERLGFSVCWGTWSASEVGAFHKRKRWFCLAMRNGVNRELIDESFLAHPPFLPTWEYIEPQRRVIERNSMDNIDARNRSLGNAIVPHQLRRAVLDMCTYSKGPKSILPEVPRSSKQKCIYFAQNDEVFILTNSRHVQPDRVLNIVFESDDKQLFACKWPTPTALQYPQFRYAWKKRNLQILVQAIYYERETRHQMSLGLHNVKFADREFAINPEFITWLMGYPTGWVE